MQNSRSIAQSAAAVSLFNAVTVKGYNLYTFGTDLLSWDEANNYTISRVSRDFGQPISTRELSNMLFKCGDSAVNAYDFGLIFSCFIAMVSAYTESGASVFTEGMDTNVPEIEVVWFGNNAILYSKERNFIIPVKSADIQEACRLHKVELNNFVDTRRFVLSRENLRFSLDTSRGEGVCSFQIPLNVQRAFPNLFDDDHTNDVLVDDPNTPWDERSALGALISSSANLNSAETTAEKYRNEQVTLESVVVRSDLIFDPTVRYNSVSEFLGSLCYSDKGVIALAVNFRNNLFVYKPWFADDQDSAVQADSNPKFEEFYNVTNECKYIARYAKSVTNVPLTAAQFDIEVFEKIKDAFYDMKLSRLKLASAFGRIVIPESVLVRGMSSYAGESLYCVVPVGAIGSSVICKAASGNLVTMSQVSWRDEAFYDITEVI